MNNYDLWTTTTNNTTGIVDMTYYPANWPDYWRKREYVYVPSPQVVVIPNSDKQELEELKQELKSLKKQIKKLTKKLES